MAMNDDLAALRDKSLADLATAHDYYTDTKMAWQMVQKIIADGQSLTIRNMTTGTITTEIELKAKVRGYIAGQLTETTFQQFMSIFEDFFFNMLRLWLTAYPQSLGKKTLDFKTILDLSDAHAITEHIVSKELYEVLYDRPAGWFAYLESKANLGSPTPGEIGRIAEAKASRDVLSHNRGIANKIYESKSGTLSRFRDGEQINIPENYHRETWDLIRKIVSDVSNAAIAKNP